MQQGIKMLLDKPTSTQPQSCKHAYASLYHTSSPVNSGLLPVKNMKQL